MYTSQYVSLKKLDRKEKPNTVHKVLSTYVGTNFKWTKTQRYNARNALCRKKLLVKVNEDKRARLQKEKKKKYIN